MYELYKKCKENHHMCVKAAPSDLLGSAVACVEHVVKISKKKTV